MGKEESNFLSLGKASHVMAFKVEGWVYAQQVISELSRKFCPLLKKGGSCASAPYLAF